MTSDDDTPVGLGLLDDQWSYSGAYFDGQSQVTYVQLADGIIGPPFVDGRRPWNGFELRMTARAIAGQNDRAGRFVCSRLQLLQIGDGPTVTSEAIRSVPVASLLRDLGNDVLRLVGRPEYAADRLSPNTADDFSGITPGWRVQLSEEDYRRLREGGPTHEALGWVAHAYRIAVVLGDPPTQAVEKLFGLPRSTAGRWVTMARAQGLLGAAEGPGKAGG